MTDGLAKCDSASQFILAMEQEKTSCKVNKAAGITEYTHVVSGTYIWGHR
jgi:hypothetical protein